MKLREFAPSAMEVETIADADLDLIRAAGTGPFTIWPVLNPRATVPSGNGAAYDQAFAAHARPETAAALLNVESAQHRMNEELDNASRAVVDAKLGTVFESLQHAAENYKVLQDQQDEYEETAKKENDRASSEAHTTQQIANGHNESPADANMTNSDGSPGVGGSSGGAVANQEPYSGDSSLSFPSGLVNAPPSGSVEIVLEPIGDAY